MPSFIFAEVPRYDVGTYAEALAECERLNAAGHLGRSNWRLPTVSELLPSPRRSHPAWCRDPSPCPETAWVVSQNSYIAQLEGLAKPALILPVSEDPVGPEPERKDQKVTGGKSRLPVVTVGKIMSHGPCEGYPESRVRDLIGRGKTAREVVDLLIPARDRLWVLTLPGVLPVPVAASVVEKALGRKNGGLTDHARFVVQVVAGTPAEQYRDRWGALLSLHGDQAHVSARVASDVLAECAILPLEPDDQEVERLLQCRDVRSALSEESEQD